jgi:hypothetical protein
MWMNFSSRTLLAVAACLATVGLLAACGDHDGGKTTYMASEAGAKVACTQYLVAADQLKENDAALFAAAAAGDLARVQQALEAGADVNAVDPLKRTPLFAAAFCNHPGVADLLVDKGGKVNATDLHGMSPLHVAVIAGGQQVALALIAKGADVNLDGNAERTPLHLAAATNQAAMVQMLLEQGANSLEKDRDGITASTLATNNGHSDIAAQIGRWQKKPKAAVKAPPAPQPAPQPAAAPVVPAVASEPPAPASTPGR